MSAARAAQHARPLLNNAATWVQLLTAAQRTAFASSPQLLASAFAKCGIWPFNPEKVLGWLRDAVAAATDAERSAAAAARQALLPPAAAAAAEAVAQQTLQQAADGASGSQQGPVNPEVTAMAVHALLEGLGSADVAAAAAAAVAATLQKKQRKAQRLSGMQSWVTGPEYEAMAAAAAEEKQRQLAEKEEKAAARRAKQAATAAKKAAVAERQALRVANGQQPRGRRPGGGSQG